MYPDSGYKTTHAQSVCTRPFSRGEGPGDEAKLVSTFQRISTSLTRIKKQQEMIGKMGEDLKSTRTFEQDKANPGCKTTLQTGCGEA